MLSNSKFINTNTTLYTYYITTHAPAYYTIKDTQKPINLNNLKYESVNLKLKSYPDLFCNSDWLPCVDNKFMYN